MDDDTRTAEPRPDARREPPPVRSAAVDLVAAIGRAFRGGWRRLGAWNRSNGAGESGFSRLVEVHALQTIGDAFVTVALAGSLFFSVSPHAARSRIGLYLLVAMAPFAVVAPVLGPMLDRFQHGRRFALAATMVTRAVLALVIAHALSGKHLTLAQTFALYPAALGVLVAQKTYSIVRAATVPRVLPAGLTLVQANSRLTMVGVFAPGVGGLLAIGMTKTVGHHWALRVGAVAYVISAIYALRLPRWADGGRDVRASEHHLGLGSPLKFGQVDSIVAGVLRAAATLRWLSGFLLFYGAFVVQEHSIGGLPKGVALVALAVGLGAGNFVGTLVGTRSSRLFAGRPSVLLLGITLATTVFTALDFGLLTVFAVAVISSATAAIAKLSLDATIQQRVDEATRTSTFARSETAMQLSWVVGGVLGILLPTKPSFIGFAFASGVLTLSLLAALGFVRYRRRHPGLAELPAVRRENSPQAP